MPFIRIDSGSTSTTVRIAAIRTLNFSKASAAKMERLGAKRLMFLWDAETRTLRMVPCGKGDGVHVSYPSKRNSAIASAGDILDQIGVKEGRAATIDLAFNDDGSMDFVIPDSMF